MKKFCLAVCLLSAFSVYAQKSGAGARISAIAAVEAYNMNQQQNKQELENAKKDIDISCADAKTADDPKTWRYKGLICYLIALDAQLSTKYPTISGEAYDAYEKALSMEESKVEVKGKGKDKIAAKAEFIEGFNYTVKALYRQGTAAFNSKEWDASFSLFDKLLKIPARTADFDTKKKIEMTFEAGEETIDMAANAAYLGGMAAAKVDKLADAERMLLPLAKGKKIKDDDIKYIYRLLSESHYNAGNKDKAKTILGEGRKLFPTDYDLLISEINYALQEGRLGELETELNQAVAADPNNVELHFVMGNMYDELFRKNIETANTAKGAEMDKAHTAAKAYLDKSVAWYKKALKIDAKHFNSLYSLGAIHINYSNHFATKLQDEKLSKDDQKKLNDSYFEYVDLGMGFLLEAEKVNGEDVGLMRALKEVYSRKNDEANFMKYKEKENELLKKGGN